MRNFSTCFSTGKCKTIPWKNQMLSKVLVCRISFRSWRIYFFFLLLDAGCCGGGGRRGWKKKLKRLREKSDGKNGGWKKLKMWRKNKWQHGRQSIFFWCQSVQRGKKVSHCSVLQLLHKVFIPINFFSTVSLNLLRQVSFHGFVKSSFRDFLPFPTFPLAHRVPLTFPSQQIHWLAVCPSNQGWPGDETFLLLSFSFLSSFLLFLFLQAAASRMITRTEFLNSCLPLGWQSTQPDESLHLANLGRLTRLVQRDVDNPRSVKGGKDGRELPLVEVSS